MKIEEKIIKCAEHETKAGYFKLWKRLSGKLPDVWYASVGGIIKEGTTPSEVIDKLYKEGGIIK